MLLKFMFLKYNSSVINDLYMTSEIDGVKTNGKQWGKRLGSEVIPQFRWGFGIITPFLCWLFQGKTNQINRSDFVGFFPK